MGYQSILDEILVKVAEMPLEDQDLLVEPISNRYKEKRRENTLFLKMVGDTGRFPNSCLRVKGLFRIFSNCLQDITISKVRIERNGNGITFIYVGYSIKQGHDKLTKSVTVSSV
jgi:hypothetical protein